MISELDNTADVGGANIIRLQPGRPRLKSDLSGARMIGLSKYLDRNTASNVCLLIMAYESMGPDITSANLFEQS